MSTMTSALVGQRVVVAKTAARQARNVQVGADGPIR